MPLALITGISGQDGTYLAQLLLEQGYQVHGVTRRPPAEVSMRDPSLTGKIVLHQADLCDHGALLRLIDRVHPQEIYNLAAESFVPESWREPLASANITALGPLRLLEAIRAVDPAIRLFQAGSSEVFGAASGEPQNETTRFDPQTPYSAAKAYAHWVCVSYRKQYGMFVSCGLLFNHESPFRDPRFVTRKVSRAVAMIHAGRQSKLALGNLDGRRDWGFAADFARAMWLALQQPRPEDYVIATGQTHTVRELVEVAFGHVGLPWKEFVEVDASLLRSAEPFVRRGDIRKAQLELGWQPTVGFEQLIGLMVDADIRQIGNGE